MKEIDHFPYILNDWEERFLDRVVRFFFFALNSKRSRRLKREIRPYGLGMFLCFCFAFLCFWLSDLTLYYRLRFSASGWGGYLSKTRTELFAIQHFCRFQSLCVSFTAFDLRECNGHHLSALLGTHHRTRRSSQHDG